MTEQAYQYFDALDSAARWLAGAKAAGECAVDLEAAGLHRYEDRICLAQAAIGGDCALFDPLADRGVLHPLGDILEDSTIRKFFHGGDYDVRLLKADAGIRLVNLFDTMIAAQFTGREKFGLAPLMEEEFGVKMDKKFQRADWSQRPLTPEQCAYAALDVAHLAELAHRLEAELKTLGRLDWVREEFALLEAVEPPPPRPPSCFNVKGAQKLEPRALAILQQLMELRDDIAKDRDRPPFKILSNAVLLAWATDPPRARHRILETKGANKGVLGRLAGRVLDAVKRGMDTPPDQCPRRERKPGAGPMSKEEEACLKRLKAQRAQVSEALKLDPGLLVNTATLEQLARAGSQRAEAVVEERFKNWQRTLLGGRLLNVIA